MEEWRPISKSNFTLISVAWLGAFKKVIPPNTTNRRKVSVRAFAKWWGLGDVLAEYRSPKPGRRRPHPLPGGIADVYRMCRDARDYEEKALTALCGLVGMRISEAMNCQVKHIHLQAKEIEVWGKYDKVRVVPLSDQAIEAIMEAMVMSWDNGLHLFSMHERTARRRITALGKRSKVARAVASHDLRATLATHIYNKTKDIVAVQEILGHEDIKTTRIYIGLMDDILRDAIDGDFDTVN